MSSWATNDPAPPNPVPSTGFATPSSADTPEPAEAPNQPVDGTKRFNVIFSKEQYETLERLAKSQQINLSQALRQAITISDIIVSANADKDTHILLKRGDSVQELKLVR
jgi:hypothetical protein